MPAIRRQKCDPQSYQLLRDSSGNKEDKIIPCTADQAKQEFDERLKQGFKHYRSYTGTDILIKTTQSVSYWVFIYRN